MLAYEAAVGFRKRQYQNLVTVGFGLCFSRFRVERGSATWSRFAEYTKDGSSRLQAKIFFPYTRIFIVAKC